MRRAGVVSAALALAAGLAAQPTSPAPALSMQEAVDAALRNYPAVKVSQEELNAAAAGIQLARTAYLPHVDFAAQVNRATRNNVFGMLLPPSGLPSMSGPVIGTNNLGTAWGSAVGTVVTWEPFDFGLRQAGVAAANASRAQAEAALQRTRFDIAVAASDTYLTLAAAQQTVRASRAAVDRAETVRTTIRALTDAQLRPGADYARAEAEVAAARTAMIQAERAAAVARANLSRFVGMAPPQIALAAPKLNELPPPREAPAQDTAANPLLLEQNAVVEQARAQLRVLERSYFPHFYLQGAAYARGTGAETNGAILGGLNGLAPSVQDYALGFSVTFPAMDKPAAQAREAAQSASVRAQEARAQQIAADLRAQWNAAVADLEGARNVAASAPAQVSAARAAVDQATARYRAGLGNIDEVAEAERLLAQAEIDELLARLGVWRGLLEVAAAAGDIQPLIAEVSR